MVHPLQDVIMNDLRKYSFTIRIVNLWNSLPENVVSANTVKTFKNRLDKFWSGQELVYDYKADLTIIIINRPLADRPDIMLNNLVARAFAAAEVPVSKEPDGLVYADSFRMLQVLDMGVTVVCSTADSYIDLAVHGPGCVAEMAASRKEAKYATFH